MISSSHDDPVTPDAIFQCDDNKKGIVAEIKTSLPDNDGSTLNALSEPIEKYSNIVKGWKTESKTIPEYSVLLLVNMLDSKKASKVLVDAEKTGSFIPAKSVCLAEWSSHMASHKENVSEIMLIRHVSGSTGCHYFDEKLSEDIPLDEEKLEEEFEFRKFIRKKPPRIYVMDIIYNFIFSALAPDDKEEFTVTTDDIINQIQEYFVSWSGMEGEQDQIKPGWVNQAMRDFCDIGIAEQLIEGSERYTIKWGHRYKKNIGKFMLEKLCGKLDEDEREKPQRRLDDFKSI